ncbi:MAG: nitrous oxide-stimulated promoter family protein [Clostridia bacterium]|nr:nitrous oxide-stimulated promoter family protein [Clostridia bacterium]
MNKTEKDIRIVLDFIKIYCAQKHKNVDKVFIEEYNAMLCPDCLDLARYAVKRRMACPKNPKPPCKKCDTPCYSPKFKGKIREVMKFSGIYLIKRGRLDYLLHYFK